MAEYINVTTLNLLAKQVLEQCEPLNNLIVCGEVSNFTRHYKSGHCYFTLKDENAAIKCVMFRDKARLLGFAPENGMLVLAYGRATLYERDGAFQLYCDYMRPFGAGAAQMAFDALKKKLSAEGLFDADHKRPLPPMPQCIGLVTSKTGAALQDVGTRFYTYYIAMIRMMEAAAQADAEVIVLDRPNPNGSYVDGPLLEERYRSGVGELPIPVVHGLTLGELARMAIGEGWVPPCRLTVVPCRDYTHRDRYVLPVPPSPNLRSQRAVYLYPSLCLMEGTVLSVGRGTERPFELYGHPDLKQALFRFTPRSVAGAAHPPFEGVCCRGYDLGEMDEERILAEGLNPEYLIDAYRALGLGEKFFTPLFEKLVGAGWVRRMIVEGRSAAELRAAWAPDVARFRELRRKYLLYPE